MDTVRTVDALRTRISKWRGTGATVGLVPTMGGLHDGHLSLIRAAKGQTDLTVATLFVNPAQFALDEDLNAYPRDEVRDQELFVAEGTDLLFAPDVEEMYPVGHTTEVHVQGLSQILEGEFRPRFFLGVATVVSKLLLQVLPDAAFFGEKDYQQLLVIRRLACDLNIPVEIVGAPTKREANGLAMSSRNQYLNERERRAAPTLYATINQVAESVRDGADADKRCRWAVSRLTEAGFRQVDYVACCDAETLELVKDSSRPARVLAAAWLGKARLIDNVAV